jgi:hypothetical protein
MRKQFLLNPKDIKQLIDPMGSCLASDKITVDGMKIGFMYREEPEDTNDSGWRFLSGTETQTYIDNPNNSMVFEVNTIANYDKAIIPYLNSSVGSELERVEGSAEFIDL